jgi:pimeloyl-ACP methyl ester carboxylesterase
MGSAPRLGGWRSERVRRRCRSLEDALWTSQPEVLDVVTSYGPTRAYRWPGAGDPVVLLHGGAVTSLTMEMLAGALPARDVYALDTMGDVGRSEHLVPFDEAHDLAAWLDEALAGLGLDRVRLVGHSAGGWVAINAAVRRPGRLSSLVLLDPAGVVPLQMGPFVRWGVPVMASTFLPRSLRARVARGKRHPLAADKRWTRLMALGLLGHRPGFPAVPPVFSDDDLAAISVPIAVVVGACTEMLDVGLLVERIRGCRPEVTTTVVADAGHALPVSHAEACASVIG